MFTDPLSVTYNATAKSLPRVSVGPQRSRYRTADGEFSVVIRNTVDKKSGLTYVSCKLIRTIPDPTPSDVFDNFRVIDNSVSIEYGFDTATRASASVDHPLLRTALLSLVDSTFQGRLVAGEL